jgi:hypothetical protein
MTDCYPQGHTAAYRCAINTERVYRVLIYFTHADCHSSSIIRIASGPLAEGRTQSRQEESDDICRINNDPVQWVNVQMSWQGYKHALRGDPNEKAVIHGAAVVSVFKVDGWIRIGIWNYELTTDSLGGGWPLRHEKPQLRHRGVHG